MNKKDLEYFRKKLEKEKALLEEELKTVLHVLPESMVFKMEQPE